MSPRPSSGTIAADAPFFAHREVAAALTELLERERSRAEHMQNVLRLIILVALGAAAAMYATALPAALSRSNLAVLAPMLMWSGFLVIFGQRRGGVYPKWISIISPVVDITAVTAIILCYGLIGAPELGFKAPIVFSYFAILGARPMTGSSRGTALTAAIIVAEYAAAIVWLAMATHPSLTLDPIAAASSASVSLLDEGMKLLLLAVAGTVATAATRWHERILTQALSAQVTKDTEERELDMRLQQADKLSALGTFAASIAHDVANPLAAIALSADMLKRSTTDSDIRSQASAIAEDARGTALVLNDMLAFSRCEERTHLPVVLDDVVEHAMTMLRHLLRDRGVEVQHLRTPGLPAIDAAAPALERLIINLVINAAQAMEAQSTPRIVRIMTSHNTQCVQLTVEDTGPGFAPGVAERLFERFFTTKPVGKGTGLGLWTVAQVVQTHGGHIAASDTGHGAQFVITFPHMYEAAAAA